MHPLFWPLTFFYISLYLRFASGKLVVKAIDNSQFSGEEASVEYYPGIEWNDQNCPECYINPDPSKAHDGTWRESTYRRVNGWPVGLKIHFEGMWTTGVGTFIRLTDLIGVAISVYFILVNNPGNRATARTECNFSLDGGAPVNFLHIPDETREDYMYNQVVYSRKDIPNGKHTLDISASEENIEVYINFDYAVYT